LRSRIKMHCDISFLNHKMNLQTLQGARVAQ
jgi:hypothetical protein